MNLCCWGTDSASVDNSRLQDQDRSQTASLLSERAGKQGCSFALTFLKVTQEGGIKFLGRNHTSQFLYLLTTPRSNNPVLGVPLLGTLPQGSGHIASTTLSAVCKQFEAKLTQGKFLLLFLSCGKTNRKDQDQQKQYYQRWKMDTVGLNQHCYLWQIQTTEKLVNSAHGNPLSLAGFRTQMS